MICSRSYACFLRINTPTTAIAMIMAIVAKAMYVIRSAGVAAEGSEVCVGVGVNVWALATLACVSADEYPYE